MIMNELNLGNLFEIVKQNAWKMRAEQRLAFLKGLEKQRTEAKDIVANPAEYSVTEVNEATLILSKGWYSDMVVVWDKSNTMPSDEELQKIVAQAEASQARTNMANLNGMQG